MIFKFLRWYAHRFRTHVSWKWNPFDLEICWHVERADWWRSGSTSGVTDVTVEVARARLDEWQDEQFARRKVR